MVSPIRPSAPTDRTTQMSAREGAHELASLMEKQLDLARGTLNPTALRLFIAAYWGRVSKYAHAIHDDTDYGRYDDEMHNQGNVVTYGSQLCGPNG